MSGFGTTGQDENSVPSTPAVSTAEIVWEESTYLGASTAEVEGNASTKSNSTAPTTSASVPFRDLDPQTIGLVSGGVVLLMIVVILTTICIQKWKEHSRKKRKPSVGWIDTRAGSGGVIMGDLTFEPKVDLEPGNVDPDASRLSVLAKEPVVNIFSGNRDSGIPEDDAAKRASLDENNVMPENKNKGLTAAVVPVVSLAKQPSVEEGSISGEPKSPNSFCSDTPARGTHQNSSLNQSSSTVNDSGSAPNSPDPKSASLPDPPPPPPDDDEASPLPAAAPIPSTVL